jgi:hypothetical protein
MQKEEGGNEKNQRLQWNLMAKCVFTTVSDIEKPIYILLLLVYGRHDSTCKKPKTPYKTALGK